MVHHLECKNTNIIRKSPNGNISVSIHEGGYRLVYVSLKRLMKSSLVGFSSSTPRRPTRKPLMTDDLMTGSPLPPAKQREGEAGVALRYSGPSPFSFKPASLNHGGVNAQRGADGRQDGDQRLDHQLPNILLIHDASCVF